MGNRIYIFDTSYIIDYPDAVNNLTGNMVVPGVVLKQLDKLKEYEKLTRKVRAASYVIREAQRANKLKIVSEYNKIDLLASHADNIIVGTAAKLKENHPGAEVILLTTDNNMKIAAESIGIHDWVMVDTNRNKHATREGGWWKNSPSRGAIAFIGIIIALGFMLKFWPSAIDFGYGVVILFAVLIIGFKWCSRLESRVVSYEHYADYQPTDWVTDPGLSMIPGNIFHKHTDEWRN